MTSASLRTSFRAATAAATSSAVLWAHAAHAALETGLETTGKEAGYEGSTQDVNVMVSGIISAVLSVVGVVFLILTIYAGFLWMTAQGNEEQVTKAKNILKNAVIGMVLVFASYAIAWFVTSLAVGDDTSVLIQN